MTESQTAQETAPGGPPLPNWMFRYIINPVIKGVLRSPLHGSMSRFLMVLTFTGRKSGKRYSTPVGYFRDGDTISFFTERPWWKNLQDGAPVEMLVQRQKLRGRANAVTDSMEIAQVMLSEMHELGVESTARRLRLKVESGVTPSLEDIAAQTQGRIMILIQIADQ